ncbi:MAG: hypothetical protein CL940_09315 [Deltaproteobacteria bacterium]|nr:hypothetical protein [Deltaproteobacteria bacterium]
MKGRWLLAFFVVGVVLAIAGDAMACPYCAGRDEGGMGATLVVGAMMIVPFAVVGVVWPIVTREEEREMIDPDEGEDSTCG